MPPKRKPAVTEEVIRIVEREPPKRSKASWYDGFLGNKYVQASLAGVGASLGALALARAGVLGPDAAAALTSPDGKTIDLVGFLDRNVAQPFDNAMGTINQAFTSKFHDYTGFVPPPAPVAVATAEQALLPAAAVTAEVVPAVPQEPELQLAIPAAVAQPTVFVQPPGAVELARMYVPDYSRMDVDDVDALHFGPAVDPFLPEMLMNPNPMFNRGSFNINYTPQTPHTLAIEPPTQQEVMDSLQMMASANPLDADVSAANVEADNTQISLQDAIANQITQQFQQATGDLSMEMALQSSANNLIGIGQAPPPDNAFIEGSLYEPRSGNDENMLNQLLPTRLPDPAEAAAATEAARIKLAPAEAIADIAAYTAEKAEADMKRKAGAKVLKRLQSKKKAAPINNSSQAKPLAPVLVESDKPEPILLVEPEVSAIKVNRNYRSSSAPLRKVPANREFEPIDSELTQTKAVVPRKLSKAQQKIMAIAREAANDDLEDAMLVRQPQRVKKSLLEGQRTQPPFNRDYRDGRRVLADSKNIDTAIGERARPASTAGSRKMRKTETTRYEKSEVSEGKEMAPTKARRVNDRPTTPDETLGLRRRNKGKGLYEVLERGAQAVHKAAPAFTKAALSAASRAGPIVNKGIAATMAAGKTIGNAGSRLIGDLRAPAVVDSFNTPERLNVHTQRALYGVKKLYSKITGGKGISTADVRALSNGTHDPEDLLALVEMIAPAAKTPEDIRALDEVQALLESKLRQNASTVHGGSISWDLLTKLGKLGATAATLGFFARNIKDLGAKQQRDGTYKKGDGMRGGDIDIEDLRNLKLAPDELLIVLEDLMSTGLVKTAADRKLLQTYIDDLKSGKQRGGDIPWGLLSKIGIAGAAASAIPAISSVAGHAWDAFKHALSGDGINGIDSNTPGANATKPAKSVLLNAKRLAQQNPGPKYDRLVKHIQTQIDGGAKVIRGGEMFTMLGKLGILGSAALAPLGFLQLGKWTKNQIGKVIGNGVGRSNGNAIQLEKF